MFKLQGYSADVTLPHEDRHRLLQTPFSINLLHPHHHPPTMAEPRHVLHLSNASQHEIKDARRGRHNTAYTGATHSVTTILQQDYS